LAPVLDELAMQYTGKVKFVEINVDNNRSTASTYGIRGVPALFFFKSGKVVDSVAGALPKVEIERKLQALLG
jgi:thioredoxin-like negative regulator of GroEL